MYTKRISFENKDVRKKYEYLMSGDVYFKYNMEVIIDTFQNIKILNVLRNNENYSIYLEKDNRIILVEIDQNNQLSISYIKSENDNKVISCIDEKEHFCQISFRIDDVLYEISIYNYLDTIIADDIISSLQDKEKRMENIRDIYSSIISCINSEHSTIIIKSLDGENIINAHHGNIINYKETIDGLDYQEKRYFKDGKYYTEKKYVTEENEIPFVKVKKNGE